MSNLLKQYINCLIKERIRSIYSDESGEHGDRFEFNKFKGFHDIHKQFEYANSFLDRIGFGSSRIVYIYSSKYVLKIALDQKGLAQNEAEVDVYTNPKTKAIVTKIVNYDDKNYNWLVSEMVDPLVNPKQFEATGTDWKTFVEDVKKLLSASDKNEDTTSIEASEFSKKVVDTIISNQLMIADIRTLNHWGKTADGRIVLLDYGYNKDVHIKHYQKAPSAAVDIKQKQTMSKDTKPNSLQYDPDAPTAPVSISKGK
jgi:hypothetical protein